MATSYVILTVANATLPSANAATLVKTTSTGTPPTNAGTLTYNTLNFAQDATDVRAMWEVPLPPDYLSTPTVTIIWGHTATSGNAVLLAGCAPATIGTTDEDAASYFAADTSGAVAVPATAGVDKSTTISLTDRGSGGTLAAGQVISVFVGRDADAAGDTASGTLKVRGAYLAYTS